MSYVYMKSLENKAEKYDSSIKTLTLGKYQKSRMPLCMLDGSIYDNRYYD
ncbi:MAG: hypothetical protein ACTSR8_01865 [Promethearchaeota archaeon]